MIIKKNKVILNDEAKEFLEIIGEENERNSAIKNNYEKKVNK